MAKCQDAHPKCKTLKKKSKKLRALGRFSKMSKQDKKEEVRMFCQLNEPDSKDYDRTYSTDDINIGGSDLCPKICNKHRKKYPKCEPEFVECLDKKIGDYCKTPGLFGKPGVCEFQIRNNGKSGHMMCKTRRRSKRIVLKKLGKRIKRKSSKVISANNNNNNNNNSTNKSNNINNKSNNNSKVSIKNISNNKPKRQTQKRKRRRKKTFVQKLFSW
jgi:hypothetical protein